MLIIVNIPIFYRKIPQPKPPKPLKRNEPEKSIFASLLETISSTLTKTVENIEKQKLEDIDDNDGDRDQVLKTTTTTTKCNNNNNNNHNV